MPFQGATSKFRKAPMSWEYIASFFDGEGCVVVSKQQREIGKKRSSHPNSVNIWLQWSQSQSQFAVLHEIADFLEKWDISVGCYYQHGLLKVAKRVDVIFVIEQMLPYLRVKRERALEALNFLNEVEELVSCYGLQFWRYETYPKPPSPIRKVK